MTDLKSDMNLSITSTLVRQNELNSTSDRLPLVITRSLINGNGPNEAQLHWHDRRTIGAEGSVLLDLAGVLVSPFGTLNFQNIRAFVVELETQTTGAEIRVRPATTNGWVAPFADASDALRITAGGVLMLWGGVNGWPVVAGTSDVLELENPGLAQVICKVVLIGTGTLS